MAVLNKIIVRDFRNIELAELHFSPNINCVSGGNGEGKTNLLDAVYYLSMTKSAFGTSDRYNFRFGTDAFTIAGNYTMESGLNSTCSIQVQASGVKKMRLDDKPYSRISDHVGKIPVVMVSPSDVSLVSESGEERRRFVNAVLSQLDRKYLHDLLLYNSLLSRRNVTLKAENVDSGLLDVIDGRLSPLAGDIYEARRNFCIRLSPLVKSYCDKLSGGKETIGIEYVSDLDRGSLEDLLAACRSKDMILRYTSVGVQRDDFVFTLDGHPIRRCGSQGQQKSFLVSLKFAQYELMKQDFGFPPLLLLDDVFDKLDMERISNLLEMVAGSDFGQIFITDSNKVRLKGIVDGITTDRRYFEASAGSFKTDYEG